MKIFRSRGMAAVVTIAAVVLSILLGGRHSLKELASEVDAAFYFGAEKDGYSIASDLEKRGNAAYNLAGIALRYYGEEQPEIQAVEQARDALAQADSVKEMAAANRLLEEAVPLLHGLLKETALSANDAKYPDRLYDEFRSRGRTIARDGYNRLAADYNRQLERFPANLLAGLTGVRPAELFE